MRRTRTAVALATVLVAAVAASAEAATNNIFTAAGTTACPDATTGCGDGGLATDAQLNNPSGVATTADGGYLIADQSNHRVRRVAPNGNITTVAGTGTAGPAGDDGPATAAQLNNPTGVAPTADGGFLIADAGNHVIRFVDADLRLPRGPQGEQGSPGPQGPQGPQGQPATRDLLAIAFGLDKLSARQGSRVTLRYAATLGGNAALEVLKGTRRVATARATARPGRNLIRWSGKVRGKRAAAGRYTLRLTVVSGDGQRATDRARLTLKRRR